MENENGIIKLTRQQIYDDIWKLSVAGVARKYNLQYARLIKSCREADIPFPSSGYWARKISERMYLRKLYHCLEMEVC